MTRKQRFGGLVGHGQQADVVDDDQVGADHPLDGLVDAVVDAVAVHQLA
jgi:hypothetical protein